MIRGIRGRKRPRTPERIEAELDFKLHNRFDIEVIDTRTGEIRQRAQAENVICNQLWTQLFTPAAYNCYIHYGTGTGTPSATDTTLFTFYGYGTPASADDTYYLNVPDGFVSYKRKIQLSENTAVGAVLTEVGIASSTSSSSLCTHAMLQDMNGNPMSITKTSTDIINIYATIFVHWNPAGYDDGTIYFIPDIANYSGDFYSELLLFLFGRGSFSNGHCPLRCCVTGFGRGLNVCATTAPNYNMDVVDITTAYNGTSKTISGVVTRFTVAQNNVNGGIRSIGLWSYRSQSQVSYPALKLCVGGAWYPGTQITGEAIGTGDGVTTDFKTVFAFVSSGTIKVDGVAVAGVSIDNKPDIETYRTEMGLFFDPIDPASTVNNHIYDTSIFAPAEERSGYGPGRAYQASDRLNYIFYNPYHELGIYSYRRGYNGTIQVSNDLVSWHDVPSTSGVNIIPEEYRYSKYFKLSYSSASMSAYTTLDRFTLPSTVSEYNIHFDTPPAAGAVITADYFTETIAKDTDHVFDLTVTLSLGEYTEA